MTPTIKTIFFKFLRHTPKGLKKKKVSWLPVVQGINDSWLDFHLNFAISTVFPEKNEKLGNSTKT